MLLSGRLKGWCCCSAADALWAVKHTVNGLTTHMDAIRGSATASCRTSAVTANPLLGCCQSEAGT